MRSLSEPEGEKYSSLTRISAVNSEVTRLSLTNGVYPMVSRIEREYLRLLSQVRMTANYDIGRAAGCPACGTFFEAVGKTSWGLFKEAIWSAATCRRF